MFQLMEGKCLRCASFLSKPQNTCGVRTEAERSAASPVRSNSFYKPCNGI
jgi:hypothetical protein